MQYTSFRIKRETYTKLRKLRNKLKLKSIDELINLIIKQQTNEN
jgi:hypothetical protein